MAEEDKTMLINITITADQATKDLKKIRTDCEADYVGDDDISILAPAYAHYVELFAAQQAALYVPSVDYDFFC